ncbi:N-acetyl sugar amidotransferase [Gammaproteobacteria bacterium]|jgi:N-acetyl sugar amidotransferase|nr:N-acetyl sugar amidotransferase [Gammaproteobacteria bacterium]
MKYCKLCLTTNLRPNSSFNREGVCIACEYSDQTFTFSSQTHLVRLKEKIKELNKNVRLKLNNYDCIVGVSGGKDSTRQALWVRDRLKMRPLLVCCAYPPYQMSDIGAANIENLINAGFDIIFDTPAPQTSRDLSKRAFIKFGNVCKASEMALFATVPRIAIDFDIKLIFWGENPALQVGDSETGGMDPLDGNNLRNLNTLVEGGDEWMDIIFQSAYKKEHYKYPSLNEFNRRNINIIYLGPAWDDWSNDMNSTFASLHGLTLRPDEENITGDISNASMIDEEFTNINMMIKYFKYGFGRTTDLVNEAIRNNEMSRQEAIDLVERYDGICDNSIIQNYCKYINISESEFWKYTNYWINDSIFTKTKKRPKPKFKVGFNFND